MYKILICTVGGLITSSLEYCISVKLYEVAISNKFQKANLQPDRTKVSDQVIHVQNIYLYSRDIV